MELVSFYSVLYFIFGNSIFGIHYHDFFTEGWNKRWSFNDYLEDKFIHDRGSRLHHVQTEAEVLSYYWLGDNHGLYSSDQWLGHYERRRAINSQKK